MTAELLFPLAGYFAATNAHDIVAMSLAFTDDAVVQDEGHRHEGCAAIRKWMQETIEKYDYAIDVIDWSRTGDGATVRVSVRGAFPGTPITLQYDFRLQGDKIGRLAIG